jgi:hypothetical protein
VFEVDLDVQLQILSVEQALAPLALLIMIELASPIFIDNLLLLLKM